MKTWYLMTDWMKTLYHLLQLLLSSLLALKRGAVKINI